MASTEIGVSYTKDGEWIGLVATPKRGGDLITMVSAGDDSVMTSPNDPQAAIGPYVFSKADGWTRTISPAGRFRISAPKEDQLSDWRLQLDGLPRMYDRLKLDAVAGLFGTAVAEQVEWYHEAFGSHPESVGDLVMTAGNRKPVSIEEMVGALRYRSLTTIQDVNHETREARADLLSQATHEGGRLVVARSVLIADAPQGGYYI
ncbi:MAG TPA: hypothetical protein VLE73_02775 [Candidatus Saccharimonadales bacterium]|nr:hypothetical protein [Candidatus Saccharimonadales bacterium]